MFQSLVSVLSNPHNRDLAATAVILIASEVHGWGKGGALVQTAMGYIAKFCAKYATADHQAMVAEVLKLQGVEDVAEEKPAAAPSA